MENKIIEMTELRDTEHRILSYMIQSNQNIEEVSKQLKKEDFTFSVDDLLYQSIIIVKDNFKKFNSVLEIDDSIQNIANILSEHHNVKRDSVLKILTQAPSRNIQQDIEIILNYSFDKAVAHSKKLNPIEVVVEDKNGRTTSFYVNNRLVEIATTNIFNLPIEVCDNFTDTMAYVSELKLDSEDTKASMTFYGDEENPDGIESIYLKKDLVFFKWFDNICEWADKYNLSEDIFPRNRLKLEELSMLNISNKNIKEIPIEIKYLTNLDAIFADDNQIKSLPLELFEMKKLLLLSFLHNEISIIPEEIGNLKNLFMFGACDNNISTLPDSFYSLTDLLIICLHGNKLTSISENIGNLTRLSSLTISNNNISILPNNILKLTNLESLDMENTAINDIPIQLLQLEKLEKLSVDDKFLPFINKNINHLKNIDTINLSESKYNNKSKIIKELNLMFRTESWIDEKDRLDNGCISLTKCSIEKDTSNIKTDYEKDNDIEKYNNKLLEIAFEITNDKPYKALDLFNDINNENTKVFNTKEKDLNSSKDIAVVLPGEMIDLSVEIICSIANTNINKALDLLDIVIDVDYFKLDALNRMDKKFNNSMITDSILRIKSKIIKYDPEYFNESTIKKDYGK